MPRPSSHAVAIEAIRVAATLFERYRQDAYALGDKLAVDMTVDERLLALDQNYAGIWEKLDLAAKLLAEEARDLTRFEAVRRQVKDTYLGFKEKRERNVSLGGIEERVTVSIGRKRIQLIEQAIAALQQALPEVSWRQQRDEDVERFLAKQRGSSRLLKPLAWVFGAGVVLALIVFLYHKTRPVDYGPHTAAIRELERALRAEPCSKKQIVKLAEKLNDAGAHRTAIERAEAFFARCGEHRRLRWATYAAHKNLGSWEGAIAEATKLIEAVPRDSDYRWWRGEIYERKGDIPRAIADYRQSVALSPFVSAIPVNLATLLERRGEPCEALFWLENFVHYHPAQRTSMMPRMARLRRNRRCASLAGEGEIAITLPTDNSMTMVRGRIKGGKERLLEVQREALFVMLPARVATEEKVPFAKAPKLIVRTPDGFFDAHLVTVDRIALGEASAPRVPAVVVPALPRDVEGIVGRSFLSRFAVRADDEAAVLRLSPLGDLPY
jgi:tetratricopeptide (TPR) repeat protein